MSSKNFFWAKASVALFLSFFKARVIDVKITWVSNYRCPITNSSNRTVVIGLPRDRAPIPWQIGARITNHDQKFCYRYDYSRKLVYSSIAILFPLSLRLTLPSACSKTFGPTKSWRFSPKKVDLTQVTFCKLWDAIKTSHANFEVTELSKPRYAGRELSDYYYSCIVFFFFFLFCLRFKVRPRSEVFLPNNALVFSWNTER